MRALLYCLCLIFTCSAVNAQTETDSIKMAVNSLFAAMRASDSTALKNCFAPGAMLQTIAKDKEGNIKLASGWKIQYLIDTRRKEACIEE